MSAREGYSAEPHSLSTLLVYIKHVRQYSTSCEDLTYEEPAAALPVLAEAAGEIWSTATQRLT